MPIRQIDSALPSSGQIVDLGCGQGILAAYLARRKERNVIGVDLDAARLPNKELANLKFIKADITKYNLKNVDGIVISDVLHHISRVDQSELLAKIAKGLKRGGILVIKEIDSKEFIRSKLTRLWDFILYPHDEISFSNSQTLTRNLKRLGFNVNVQRVVTWFPGSTTLYICTKR
ncbi:MAG: class I SAM-dependent methyltransferase [Candidatus Curtissbacteria bacterium]|nr:class I SAM-dependent methyltransferase [Candidatus Curtissbacteria bacterium]